MAVKYGVTIAEMEAMETCAMIDRAAARQRSERGFNTRVTRVKSDRPTRFRLWDSKDVSVTSTRTSASPVSYKQAYRAAQPLTANPWRWANLDNELPPGRCEHGSEFKATGNGWWRSLSGCCCTPHRPQRGTRGDLASQSITDMIFGG